MELPQQPGSPIIKVTLFTLLLMGGHQHAVMLRLDAPLLRQLFKVIAARS